MLAQDLGLKINWTTTQSRHKLPIRTLMFKSQTHSPALMSSEGKHWQDWVLPFQTKLAWQPQELLMVVFVEYCTVLQSKQVTDVDVIA